MTCWSAPPRRTWQVCARTWSTWPRTTTSRRSAASSTRCRTTSSPRTPRWRSARRGLGSVAGQSTVGDPVRAGGFDAKPLHLVLLVGREVALEPEPLRVVLVIALPGEDVGGDAVEEPPVVGGDDRAAREVEQRVLQ